jgi:hypothetical protein
MCYVFWCILEDGRYNSLSTFNLFEAPRLARKLGAVRLFGKLGDNASFELCC